MCITNVFAELVALRACYLAVLLMLCGCSAPGGTDGGLGGGSGGGSSGGGGTGAGGGGAITFEQYCASLDTLICEYGTRCGSFETRAGCAEVLSQRGPGLDSCSVLRPSVNDGRIVFDGTTAAQCVRDATSGCVQPASCGDFFAGQVPLDGGCFNSEDCVAGAWCDASSLACPGRCRQRVGVGEPITNSQACLEGLTVQFGAADGGFGYTCGAPATLGQPCTGYGGCAGDLVCNPRGMVCETPRGLGEVCHLPDGGVVACATGLFCQPEAGSSRALCGPPVALGGRCGTCRLDLRCANADGGAVCMPRGLLNESCNRTSECGAGLFCLPNSGPGPGTCATLHAEGELCTGGFTESCLAGLRCTFVAPADGGLIAENRCTVSDGGTGTCVDPTP